MTALFNGAAVSDVTLSGNAVWTSGTNSETGTATAYGKTNVESRLDLALGGGNPASSQQRGRLAARRLDQCQRTINTVCPSKLLDGCSLVFPAR